MKLPECSSIVLGSIADALYPPPLGLLNDDRPSPHSSSTTTLISSLPSYIDRVIEAIETKLSDHEVHETSILLKAINTRLGTAIIFGSVAAKAAFPYLSIDERQILLHELQTSKFETKRKIFQSLKKILMGTAFSYSVYGTEKELIDEINSKKDGEDEDDDVLMINPMWKALDYPGPPILQAAKAKSVLRNNQKYDDEEKKMIHQDDDDDNCCYYDPIITPPYNFRPATTTKHATTTTYDYIIVGSGSGGSVAAATLKEVDPDCACLVIEKGTPVRNNQNISQVESFGIGNYYEKGGLLTTDDGNITILAGSCLGGGSTINWGCCLDTPRYVRDEWSSNEYYGLKQFNTKEYDDATMYVKNKMNVHHGDDTVIHNGMNRRLIEGSVKAGYEWKVCPQNIQNTSTPSAGWTCFGSRQGNKQGATNTFLRDYCDAGGEIIYGDVLKVITTSLSSKEGDEEGTKKKTKQVLVKLNNNNSNSYDDGIDDAGDVENKKEKEVLFTARRAIIVSAGSLHTPCLLQRSGYINSNIGKNLRLHPVACLVGDCFNSSSTTTKPTPSLSSSSSNNEVVDGYKGAPMTAVVTSFEMGIKNDGYGYKIECPSCHPGLFAASIPWRIHNNNNNNNERDRKDDEIGIEKDENENRHNQEFKTSMEHLKYTTGIIILQRDSGIGGSVVCGKDGFNPKVKYKLNSDDSKSILHGMHKGFDLLRNVSSVRTIQTLHASQNIYDNNNNNNNDDAQTATTASSALRAYHDRIDELGCTETHGLGISSAHQMGSCRMGLDPYKGAVDENGELWESDDVYVMDASVFPTSSGANPMITTMSISRMLSLRLATTMNNKNNRLSSSLNGNDDDETTSSSIDGRRKRRNERRLKWKGKEVGDATKIKIIWSFASPLSIYTLGLMGAIVAWLIIKCYH